MIVGELLEKVESRSDRALHATLGDVRVANDASVLEITGTFDGDSEPTNIEFPLDELAEGTLARYLEINKTYLAKCPPELKAANLNHWLHQYRDAETVFQTMRGGTPQASITQVHKEGLLVLPVPDVARVISRVFNENDEVIDWRRDDKRFQADIKIENLSIEVPNPERIEGRPEVGDITHGGVRILSYPQEAIAPIATSYLHRVWCRNGSCEDYGQHQVRLRGSTVPEVLAELENAARNILGELPSRLRDYGDMVNHRVPGSVTDFVFQVAHENDLGTRLTAHLHELATQLPDNATLYDVQQLFTTTANEVSFSAASSLQRIGGDMAFRTERVLHRCSTCEQTLPGTL